MKRLRRSVYLKLLATCAASGLLVNLLVVLGTVAAVDREPFMERVGQANVQKYFAYLSRDLGLPPDPAALTRLAQEIGFEIRIEYQGRSYASAPDLPSLAAMKDAWWREAPRLGLRHARFGGRGVFHHRQGDADYLFYMPKGVPFDVDPTAAFGIAALVALVLLAALWQVKRILRPVRELSQGVARLAAGDLTQDVAVAGEDELATLARSFNTMTARLREMLASRQQLLLDVSHELRSPLARMKLALEFLDDSKARRSLGEDVAELDRMVGEILDSARLDSAHGGVTPAPTDLRPLLAELVRLLSGQEPGITLAEAAGPLVASADAARTRTVLRNVLENALKYSAGAAQPVEVAAATEGGRVVVTVRDHGVGIPEGELERVFEPFYRVDKSRSKETGGFGLGLALCRKIMQRQGGQITVASRPGAGTTVTLTFDSAAGTAS